LQESIVGKELHLPGCDVKVYLGWQFQTVVACMDLPEAVRFPVLANRLSNSLFKIVRNFGVILVIIDKRRWRRYQNNSDVVRGSFAQGLFNQVVNSVLI